MRRSNDEGEREGRRGKERANDTLIHRTEVIMTVKKKRREKGRGNSR